MYFLFCALRIYLLELIRFFFFFCTLVLLPFRLCLDHSFKELAEQPPLSIFISVPVVLRVQRYCFFLSVQLFLKKIFIYFILFHYPLSLSILQNTSADFLPFLWRFRPRKSAFYDSFRMDFKRKISQTDTKTRKTWTQSPGLSAQNVMLLHANIHEAATILSVQQTIDENWKPKNTPN